MEKLRHLLVRHSLVPRPHRKPHCPRSNRIHDHPNCAPRCHRKRLIPCQTSRKQRQKRRFRDWVRTSDYEALSTYGLLSDYLDCTSFINLAFSLCHKLTVPSRWSLENIFTVKYEFHRCYFCINFSSQWVQNRCRKIQSPLYKCNLLLNLLCSVLQLFLQLPTRGYDSILLCYSILMSKEKESKINCSSQLRIAF